MEVNLVDEDIIEGEVIEPEDGRIEDLKTSADFEAFDEKELNPLLKARARNFEQRLSLLADYQQALLRIVPDEEIEPPAASSKPTVPLVGYVIETCGKTLVHLGTWLLTDTNAAKDTTMSIAEKEAIDVPFDSPFVFCYRDEGGEDEPTK
jgi:hypothetical protein